MLGSSIYAKCWRLHFTLSGGSLARYLIRAAHCASLFSSAFYLTYELSRIPRLALKPGVQQASFSLKVHLLGSSTTPLSAAIVDHDCMAATGMMAYPIRDSYSSYPQQYQIYHTRAQQPQPQSSSLLHGYPYNNISPASQHQQYHVPPSRSPQLLRQESSGSTGSEDGSRPSLPSISNLLGIADGDKDHCMSTCRAMTSVSSLTIIQLRNRRNSSHTTLQ